MSTSYPLVRVIGGVSAVAAVAVTGLGGCTQKDINCTTGKPPYAFAVKLALTSGTGECSENPGGVYGVNSYNYPTPDGRLDFDRGSVAIQSDEIIAAVREAEDRTGAEIGSIDTDSTPYALGDWGSAFPDGNRVCAVPSMTVAQQSIPALDLIPAVPDDPATPDEDESVEEVPAKPAETFQYEWTDVKFFVTVAAPGTMFVGHLKYTHDGCTAEYDAMGVYPAVHCDDGEGNPDDSACEAEANPEEGRPVGSGINPDFNVSCDPVLLLCMLNERPPIP